MALKECGYEAVSHPYYGQLLKPKMDEASITKRKNYTMVDLRLSNNVMRVTQAIQNLTGEQTLANDLIGFLKPNSISQQDRVSACQVVTVGVHLITFRMAGSSSGLYRVTQNHRSAGFRSIKSKGSQDRQSQTWWLLPHLRYFLPRVRMLLLRRA